MLPHGVVINPECYIEGLLLAYGSDLLVPNRQPASPISPWTILERWIYALPNFGVDQEFACVST